MDPGIGQITNCATKGTKITKGTNEVESPFVLFVIYVPFVALNSNRLFVFDEIRAYIDRLVFGVFRQYSLNNRQTQGMFGCR